MSVDVDEATGAGRLKATTVAWFFVGVLGVRILIALLCPCDLAGDEAYYWEWGQHPAWGYYSKPPGIAWIMALAGWLGNDSVIGIRLVAAAFGVGSGWWIYLLSRHLYGQRAGLLAALLFYLTPAAAGLSFLLTIDSPLMFFWSGALYFFFRLAFGDECSRGGRGRRLIGLALCIACGTLVKQMMLVFPVIGLLALLLFSKQNNKGAVIAALLLPILILVPNLLWNSHNGWPTAQHTAEHFAASSDCGFAAILGRLSEFAASQLGLASPVIGMLIVLVCVAVVRRWNAVDPATRSLWLFSAPGILVMAAGNISQRINPNWPAVYYLAAIVLCAGWITRAAHGQSVLRVPGAARSWLKASIVTGGSLTVGIYVALALSCWWGGASKWLPATQRLHGWTKLAAEIETLRAEVPRPNETIFISRSHRFLTSQMAFLLTDHPRIYRYLTEPGIDSQHAFWSGPETEIGADALILLVGKSRHLPSDLRKRFASVEMLAKLEGYDQVAGGPVTVFLGRDLQKWPVAGDDVE